jgi:hypothetical protein
LHFTAATAAGALHAEGTMLLVEVLKGGTKMTTALVDEFLQCIEEGRMSSCTVLADGAVLDATVPNWRFAVHGAAAVAAELGRWYADPGRFEDLRRVPIPGGELVEFTLCWEEGGAPHACHQIHVLHTAQGGIVSDRAWCGGRWPASLLAEMAAAAPAAS